MRFQKCKSFQRSTRFYCLNCYIGGDLITARTPLFPKRWIGIPMLLVSEMAWRDNSRGFLRWSSSSKLLTGRLSGVDCRRWSVFTHPFLPFLIFPLWTITFSRSRSDYRNSHWSERGRRSPRSRQKAPPRHTWTYEYVRILALRRTIQTDGYLSINTYSIFSWKIFPKQNFEWVVSV